MKATRSERRRAARKIAATFGVPFAVAARTVEHVTTGRAAEGFAESVGLPSVPVTLPRLDEVLRRAGFPEVERASLDEKAAWSSIVIDPTRAAAERLAASEKLAEALGMFDGMDPEGE